MESVKKVMTFSKQPQSTGRSCKGMLYEDIVPSDESIPSTGKALHCQIHQITLS